MKFIRERKWIQYGKFVCSIVCDACVGVTYIYNIFIHIREKKKKMKNNIQQ
jgi:hypothetical protein